MIVKCIQLYNQNTKQYLNAKASLTKGCHYNVLEIYFSIHGLKYRVLADDDGVNGCGILVRAQDFEIVSTKNQKNWVMNSINENLSSISPSKWVNHSLWEESFWQDYEEAKPNALKCFREEVKEIIKTDEKYMEIMIEERPKDEVFRNWHETMIPLFNEIRGNK